MHFVPHIHRSQSSQAVQLGRKAITPASLRVLDLLGANLDRCRTGRGLARTQLELQSSRRSEDVPGLGYVLGDAVSDQEEVVRFQPRFLREDAVFRDADAVQARPDGAQPAHRHRPFQPRHDPRHQGPGDENGPDTRDEEERRPRTLPACPSTSSGRRHCSTPPRALRCDSPCQ